MSETPNVVYRKILTSAIAALLTEVEYDTIEKMALETIVEMTQSLITSLGETSRSYSELSGRTVPLVGDIIVALVHLGLPVDGIEKHAKRSRRLVLPPLMNASQAKQFAILQAGQKLPHPAHIPSQLPSFPDPHAYIRTPTHKQPVTEYEALREKAAAQKRDLERSLTRFEAKTGDTHSLFLNDDTNLFPLIACKPQSRPYLDALLPRDQIFEEDPDLSEDDMSPPQQPRWRSRAYDSSSQSATNQAECKSPSSETASTSPTPCNMETTPPPAAKQNTMPSDNEQIDNPYLRPIKIPRRSKK